MATNRATIRSSLLMVVVSMLFLGAEYELLVLAGVGFVLLGAFLIQYRPGIRLLDSPKTLAFRGVALCGTGALARWRLRCEHYASAGGFVLGRDLPNNGLHGQVSPIQMRQGRAARSFDSAPPIRTCRIDQSFWLYLEFDNSPGVQLRRRCRCICLEPPDFDSHICVD